ncbi:glycine--tRNA ligase subunit beta [Aestuariibius sp. HNIBRBA575]|uniref:glycine--tRNA ligase subunit beta n=1 Tax=Aestuariibius sp. HNIBRBA575 TaxID=3233343 RepID=UPI0034A52C19
MPDLLIELFSEEIPARMQAKAAADLKKLITDGLVEAGLTYASAASFSTPRRLTLTIEGLSSESPDTREERKGPKVGAPDKALEGFLRGAGVQKSDLVARETPKGEVYFAIIEHKGRPAADIIADVLEATIRNFPWPKSMRWGAGALRWVRPLHSILCILTDDTGAKVVPMDVDGIVSGDTTMGHRFLSEGAIRVTSFDDYEVKLKQAKVVLRADERADAIWQDASNQAFAVGLELVEDKALLAEVAGLVEWPVVLMGEIGADFLALPPEVLTTSMKEHQKFFSVRDPKSGQIVRFVTVANVETSDNGATILAGNQKVLAARLADAKFFWQNDLRVAEQGAQGWIDSLENVTFHNQLGSQAARIDRIAGLAQSLAPIAGADADIAGQAARWAKVDLSSEMVYEFPELQGLMGRYYAGPAGHNDDIAAAAQEHYQPLGPSDDVPTAPVSVSVALADKLDTLTGFWIIDEKPTGSKDPYALRRAALGVIRLILDNKLRLRLDHFFDLQLLKHKIELNRTTASAQDILVLEDIATEIAKHGVFGAAYRSVIDALDRPEGDFVELVQKKVPDASVSLLGFFHDRLKQHLRDEGIRHDVIDACLAMPGNDDLLLLVNRASALSAVLATDDGENLLQGYKRANNILTQAEEKDGVEYSYGADVKYAEDDSEKALFAALDQAEATIAPALESEDFGQAMAAMASLRAPIDAFFEAVQVNAESQILRRNRLNLLSRIRGICLSVADLNRIEG